MPARVTCCPRAYGYFDRCIAGFSVDCLAALRLCAVLISAIWRQRLREIAGLAAFAGIEFLRQQAEIVGDRDHAAEQRLRPWRTRPPAHRRRRARGCRRETRLRSAVARLRPRADRAAAQSRPASGAVRSPRACRARGIRRRQGNPPTAAAGCWHRAVSSRRTRRTNSARGQNPCRRHRDGWCRAMTASFSSGALKPNFSALLMPRSNATQVITFDET